MASRHFLRDIVLTRAAFSQHMQPGVPVPAPAYQCGGAYDYNNPVYRPGATSNSLSISSGGFSVALATGSFEGAPGSVPATIEYDLPTCSGYAIRIGGVGAQHNPNREDGKVEFEDTYTGQINYREGWYHWTFSERDHARGYAPNLIYVNPYFTEFNDPNWKPQTGSIYRIPISLHPDIGQSSVKAHCGTWEGGRIVSYSNGGFYASGEFEFDAAQVPSNGIFSIVGTLGLLEARAELQFPPFPRVEVGLPDEGDAIYNFDATSSLCVGLALDSPLLEKQWGFEQGSFTTSEADLKAQWDAQNWASYDEVNLIDGEPQIPYFLSMIRHDLFFNGVQSDLIGSVEGSVPAPVEQQIGALHNHAGELFTAGKSASGYGSSGVTVWRFTDGVASRVALATIAGAKNPSLYWRDGTASRFELRLMLQEGDNWNVRSSHDGGRSFEMAVNVWGAPYKGAVSTGTRNGDVSAARNGQNVYFRRATGDAWSDAPVFVGTIPTGSNKALCIRQVISGLMLEITNSYDRVWRSSNMGRTWTAV